ncbi:hypothetical protein MTQ04_03480 [Micrococcus sp. XM4230A]|uniref:hypothetical protein n=1 Tax=Micrococcus TaxID=1269 RepID=UPI0011AE3ABD|nr:MULTISPECIES: hypothetical protein [Micrococcus]MCK1799980.1 hypothetical protein [Micrococcus sp. XM4230B]MCK1811010.1 hypothetical protein [Micrococcus sp. XM4230A]
MSSSPQTMLSGSFFPISRFRLISATVLLIMSIVALTPWSFETRIGGMALINILLTAVMLYGLVVLIIDLMVTRETAAARTVSTEERHD